MKITDSDFELFGLPPRFGLDAAALESQWKALQAAAHPDRHATEGASAQRIAMQWAIRINEAYRRLKDPLRRAVALCELHGIEIGEHDNTAMPADFLMQQMDWRERLEEADGAAAVERLADEVGQRRLKALASLARRIDESNPVDWSAVAQEVRGLMFVERFLADVDRRLDALAG